MPYQPHENGNLIDLMKMENLVDLMKMDVEKIHVVICIE